ncbi:MAG: ChaN family lipoprotein [Candidatus Anammoximicrobium sp.]|nr:ChaN family lipoprotein [Candidatus Anammoximicrobium sp.]
MTQTTDLGERLVPVVREIAWQLDETLRGAHGATGGWSDATATERLARAALQVALDRLSATACWGEANRLPSGELWRIAGHWLEVGTLQWRARTKPRGYAGDFEMLEQICAHHVCDHPLGAVFDRFFQAQAAPQAVRNRTALIAQSVVQFVRACRATTVHVVSVGSGPAIDLQRACTALTAPERRRLRLTLLDLDPLALDQARLRLSAVIDGPQLRPVRENLFRLGQPGRGNDAWRETDFLICSGLFDYLDETAAAALLSHFWDSLRPGGGALVFNFAPHNPSRAYMEWIGNWYLTYRDRRQLRDAAARAGIPDDCVTLEAESSGVNLYWRIRRPSA